MIQKNYKRLCLSLINMVLVFACIGQTNKNDIYFSFNDTYGNEINIRNTAISKFVDSAFIRNNFDTKMILSFFDTATTKYKFTFDKIIGMNEMSYEIKIEIGCEFKERIYMQLSDSINTQYIGKRKKQLCGSGINVYKMKLVKVDNKYKIEKFFYLFSEI